MRRILVIAPHGDDEVIGCGGLIALAALRGATVTLVVMAAGGIKHNHLPAAVTLEQRQREIASSAKTLGVAEVHILFPGHDMQLEGVEMRALVSALDEVLAQSPFDECYLPEPSHNLDHRRTHEACLAALRPCGAPRVPLIAAYEGTVQGWTLPAGAGGKLYIDISTTLETKLAALQCYKSQLRSYPHPTSAEAVRRIAAMRGLECGLDHAERLQILRMVVR